MLRKTIILMILLIFAIAIQADGAQMASANIEDELPDVAFIERLVAHGQTYPMSCESRSASDLAGYWGVNAPEVEFYKSLPVSDNPEVGFVGSVFGAWGGIPPNAYGVHAKPVAALLREYGLDATARRGMTITDLKYEIANGRPVIVWVVGHVWQGIPKEYHAKDGSTVIVASYEHTMIAYGYDLAGIYLVDAANAARRGYSYQIFSASWAVLGNMAVTATGAKETHVQSQTFTSGEVYTVQKGDYLSKLALQWGIDWVELAKINNIAWPYSIFPGQVLITKGEEEPREPTQTPATAELTEEAALPQPTATLASTFEPEVRTETNKADNEGETIPPPENYTVKKGEHLMQIARDMGLNWLAIAEMNQLAPPYQLFAGQVLILPGPGMEKTEEISDQPYSGDTYIVQQGEYLYKIGSELGISWRALAEINGISSPYIVYPNQALRIP